MGRGCGVEFHGRGPTGDPSSGTEKRPPKAEKRQRLPGDAVGVVRGERQLLWEQPVAELAVIGELEDRLAQQPAGCGQHDTPKRMRFANLRF